LHYPFKPVSRFADDGLADNPLHPRAFAGIGGFAVAISDKVGRWVLARGAPSLEITPKVRSEFKPIWQRIHEAATPPVPDRLVRNVLTSTAEFVFPLVAEFAFIEIGLTRLLWVGLFAGLYFGAHLGVEPILLGAAGGALLDLLLWPLVIRRLRTRRLKRLSETTGPPDS
jgi:hypothetical protein